MQRRGNLSRLRLAVVGQASLKFVVVGPEPVERVPARRVRVPDWGPEGGDPVLFGVTHC